MVSSPRSGTGSVCPHKHSMRAAMETYRNSPGQLAVTVCVVSDFLLCMDLPETAAEVPVVYVPRG